MLLLSGTDKDNDNSKSPDPYIVASQLEFKVDTDNINMQIGLVVNGIFIYLFILVSLLYMNTYVKEKKINQ